jgi:hypothetical protein
MSLDLLFSRHTHTHTERHFSVTHTKRYSRTEHAAFVKKMTDVEDRVSHSSS